jgi:hypothetical protein
MVRLTELSVCRDVLGPSSIRLQGRWNGFAARLGEPLFQHNDHIPLVLECQLGTKTSI